MDLFSTTQQKQYFVRFIRLICDWFAASPGRRYFRCVRHWPLESCGQECTCSVRLWSRVTVISVEKFKCTLIDLKPLSRNIQITPNKICFLAWRRQFCVKWLVETASSNRKLGNIWKSFIDIRVYHFLQIINHSNMNEPSFYINKFAYRHQDKLSLKSMYRKGDNMDPEELLGRSYSELTRYAGSGRLDTNAECQCYLTNRRVPAFSSDASPYKHRKSGLLHYYWNYIAICFIFAFEHIFDQHMLETRKSERSIQLLNCPCLSHNNRISVPFSNTNLGEI